MSDPIINVKNFRMDFGTKTVIDDLSFTVNRGEIMGFLGANGSGKTTTIRALLDVYTPSAGTLTINNRRFDSSMANILGYLPEERGLYTKEKVLDVMIYFARLKGLGKSEAQKKSLRYLEQVDLAEKAHDKINKLSGGQQQKVQLGVTIVNDPELLILDEPTKGLDPVNRTLLMDIIEQHHQRGATIMMVTHQMDEVEQLCDRVMLLKDGRRRLYGSIDEVKDTFGSPIIAVRFEGKLPQNPNLYHITKQLPRYAELQATEDIHPTDILRFLSQQKNMTISLFENRRSSLNDIFVKIYQENKASHVAA